MAKEHHAFGALMLKERQNVCNIVFGTVFTRHATRLPMPTKIQSKDVPPQDEVGDDGQEMLPTVTSTVEQNQWSP
jgi:hypothetical protein